MRYVEIHSGLPPGERIAPGEERSLHHAAQEHWFIMFKEDGESDEGMFSKSWESICAYAQGWLMGESVEEMKEKRS